MKYGEDSDFYTMHGQFAVELHGGSHDARL